MAKLASVFVAWLTSCAAADHWAVLVAGSKGFYNYRHQADVCHAYQILSKSLNSSNIIVMAYDDIANSISNPFPGKIFNKPTPAGVPGVDVYAGCKIDYSGAEVTPKNFVKVLTGDTSAGGPVLRSGPDSRVFINFVDHGATNLIAFPEGTLHSTELTAALTLMHTKEMYKELVFYLEACESGSMFTNLPTSLNIFATTASNAAESSWGTYCMPDDMVDGKEIHSCLGDLYSVNWMEDSDKHLVAETLENQYDTVKTLTAKSHVMQYGTSAISLEEVTNFQGSTDNGAQGADHHVARKLEGGMVEAVDSGKAEDSIQIKSALPSRHIELYSTLSRFLATEAIEDANELIALIKERADAKVRFDRIAKAVTGKLATAEAPAEVDESCHFSVHKHYTATCGEWTPGALKHSATLAALCAATGGDPSPIKDAIAAAC